MVFTDIDYLTTEVYIVTKYILRRYGPMVECDVANVMMRVRFPLPAPSILLTYPLPSATFQ